MEHTHDPGALERTVTQLLTTSPEIQGCLLASEDGLPIAVAVHDDADETRIGAMSALLLALSGSAAEDLGLGGLEQILIDGEDGSCALQVAAENTVLTTTFSKRAKLGLIFLEVNAAVAAIRNEI